MKNKNDQGFSLIEVLVAIVLLAAFVVPTCSALVLSARMNAKSQALMQAQLDVSSAVETLMARGVDEAFLNNLNIVADAEHMELINEFGEKLKESQDQAFVGFPVFYVIEETETSAYKVLAISEDGSVRVETTIRAALSGGGSQ